MGELEVSPLATLVSDGTITVSDLENYYTSVEQPVAVQLNNGNYTVIAPQPPSSGVVLEFMLQILDGKASI